MIQLTAEKDLWSNKVNNLDALTIYEIIELGKHWIQIKTLEQNDLSVYGSVGRREGFDSEMRGVASFLLDLHKKIGQQQ